MEMIFIIVKVIMIVLFTYSAFSVIYLLVFAIAGLFKYSPKIVPDAPFKKFAVLIPGYKEDSVIVEVAKEALKQKYPEALYKVIVIADSFSHETLVALNQLPIEVIVVEFDKSTKAKSINAALNQIKGDNYDNVVILDADNVMMPDFLMRVNQALHAGFKVVQGHRIAKNTNTSFAILDAINEEINNHIFRKGHRVLGVASSLIGSGMAFDFQYFDSVMKNINDVAGEDKEIEISVLGDGESIEYLPLAYVKDEKVQSAHVFSNQRTRWIAAQIYFLKRSFFHGVKEFVTKGNFDLFDKALQTMLPPRILLLGGLVLLSALHFFLPFSIPAWWWLAVLALNCFALLISVPGKFFNRDLFKAIINIPVALIYMIRALLRIKGADKKFIHTPHTSTENWKE